MESRCLPFTSFLPKYSVMAESRAGWSCTLQAPNPWSIYCCLPGCAIVGRWSKFSSRTWSTDRNQNQVLLRGMQLPPVQRGSLQPALALNVGCPRKETWGGGGCLSSNTFKRDAQLPFTTLIGAGELNASVFEGRTWTLQSTHCPLLVNTATN